MKTLFFDIQITGHHSEYISHLVDYFYDNKSDDHNYFIVNPDFSKTFPAIANKAKSVKSITWIEIEKEKFERWNHAKIIKKSFLEFQLMHHYAKLNQINHACLLYFNTFQLALIFYRPSYTISGILFLQFYRMNVKTLKDKVRYYRKYYTSKLFSYNPKIKKIFVLNDTKTVDFLNQNMARPIFNVLPDPIPNLQPLDEFDVYKEYKIETHRKIFLHIGTLNPRKGTLEILESIALLSPEMQQNLCFLIAGKANEAFETELKTKIMEYNQNFEVQILWDNTFVSNEKMKSLFDSCFCVLMPYKNAEASSGILGHAANAQKMVIAPNSGLLKEMIIDNSLGILIDKVEPKCIAEAIVQSFDYRYSTSKSTCFVDQRSTENFSIKIICLSVSTPKFRIFISKTTLL